MPVVERVTVTPPIVTCAVTSAVNTPAELELMVTVQVAVSPLTDGEPQVVLMEAGAGLTLGVIEVKLTGDAPAGIAVTVTVKTCWWPTSFTALGAMATDAST